MKLRFKILLSLVSVGVLPLVVSLWLIGGMAFGEFETQVLSRSQDAANFIEQSTTKISSEDLTLVEMMSGNPFLVNAVYSAGLSGDQAQLANFFASTKGLSFDQLQVLDKEGQKLYRLFLNGS
jgi:hypothetical protein